MRYQTARARRTHRCGGRGVALGSPEGSIADAVESLRSSGGLAPGVAAPLESAFDYFGLDQA